MTPCPILSPDELLQLQKTLSDHPILNNGKFVYLKIPDSLITTLFKRVQDSDAEMPPFFSRSGVGAHVSLIINRELRLPIPESAERINDLALKSIYTVVPVHWKGITKAWCVEVESLQCQTFRKKNGYSSLIDGHCFHITFAVSRKTVDPLPKPLKPRMESIPLPQTVREPLTLTFKEKRPLLPIPTSLLMSLTTYLPEECKPLDATRIELLSPDEKPPQELSQEIISDLRLLSIYSITERFGELSRTLFRVEIHSERCAELRLSWNLSPDRREEPLFFELAKRLSYSEALPPLRQGRIPKGPLNEKGQKLTSPPTLRRFRLTRK